MNQSFMIGDPEKMATAIAAPVKAATTQAIAAVVTIKTNTISISIKMGMTSVKRANLLNTNSVAIRPHTKEIDTIVHSKATTKQTLTMV